MNTKIILGTLSVLVGSGILLWQSQTADVEKDLIWPYISVTLIIIGFAELAITEGDGRRSFMAYLVILLGSVTVTTGVAILMTSVPEANWGNIIVGVTVVISAVFYFLLSLVLLWVDEESNHRTPAFRVPTN